MICFWVSSAEYEKEKEWLWAIMDGGYDASENMEGAYLSVLVNIVLLV